jgi:hypothetical protein
MLGLASESERLLLMERVETVLAAAEARQRARESDRRQCFVSELGLPLKYTRGTDAQAHQRTPSPRARACDELPTQIATYQRELDATPAENRARRARLEWQIRNLQKRLAAIETRLRAISE